MTAMSTSMSTDHPHLQPELFRPALQYPSHPYAEMLTRTAERYPEQEAILFKDVNLTYRELDALANAFANALLDLGIGKGQRVCLFMANRPEYLISWFAITRIGAVASPMNPSYKEREVAYQLSNSEAVAVVIQPELLQLTQAVRAETPALEHVITVGSSQQVPQTGTLSFSHLLSAHSSMPPAVPEPAWEDVVTLPYSSGTTGLPKGVMLS